MPQPICATPLYASDFPPKARVCDVARRLRRRGYVLACSNGQFYAIRMH